MAPDAFERELAGRLQAELDQVSGPRPQWSEKEPSMSESNQDQPKSSHRGWILSGAIVVIVAGVLLVSQLPHGSAAGAGPSPSPTTALTDHEVATDQGIVSFQQGNGSIVVRLTAAGTTTELGRTSGLIGGGAGYAMVCGPADGPDSHRYFFGHTDTPTGIEYSGPPAVGQVAPDGTFLFALLPGTIGTTFDLKLAAAKGAGGGGVGSIGFNGGFDGGVFADTIASGQRQASGCYVSE